jgi:anthranilate synthase component 1
MRRRVISSHYGGWVDPAECFVAMSGSGDPVFWLDSGLDSRTGMSCIGRGSRVVTETRNTLHEWPSGVSTEESIFDFMRREQAPGVTGDTGELGFPLGWVGWLGYELHETTLHTGLGRVSRYPDAAFLFAERAIVFDHAARSVTLVAFGDAWSGELATWKDEMGRMMSELGRGGVRDAGACARATHQRVESSTLVNDAAPGPRPNPELAYTDREYLTMIEECQSSIRAGDAYQLCLTTQVTLDAHPDPVDTYLRLRTLSPSHHGGFLRIGEVCILSSSPEKFLTVSPDGEVESKPIKGTRKRGSTREADAALRCELLASDKERAENLMIVDLVRNDLSRVCEVGSVSVPVLLDVESYAQVHQLVSTVRGTLAPGCDAVDAVVACFPAGSMTGAPKLSAVRLLDALERRPRGIYSGVWGYFGLDGSIDLAMTIRSIVIDSHGVSMGTGGGITALSVPEEELEEVRIKAAALLRALGLIPL